MRIILTFVLIAIVFPMFSAPRAEDHFPTARSAALNATDAADFREKLAELVAKWLQTEESQYRAIGFVESRPISIDFGAPISVSLFRMPKDGDVSQVAYVKVEQIASSRIASEYRIYFRRYLKGLVANRTIPANSVLRCADFSIDYVPIAAEQSKQPIAAPCTADAFRTLTKRSIPFGEPLRYGDTAAEQLIMQGQTVRIRVQIASVTMERPGIALSDASSGDLLKVKIDNPASVIAGRVQLDGSISLNDAKP